MNKNITAHYFDENLRDIPSYPEELKKYTEQLIRKFKLLEAPKEKVQIMGESAVYLRQLGNLDQAESILKEALKIIAEKSLGLKLEVQQKIRLAHVLQWNKEFKKSDELFSEVLNICRSKPEVNGYLAFALQHSGKNLFDQDKFNEALSCFNEALGIRLKQGAPVDQVASSKLAINEVKKRLGLK